ncbi:MAG: hypothetical protein AAFR79_00315 [Pseudomonadota bacterium]
MQNQQTTEFILTANLKPADATAAKDGLLTALGEAAKAGGGLTVELDEDAPLTCALQLLVAVEHSASAAATPLSFGPRAQAARSTLSNPNATENEAK